MTTPTPPAQDGERERLLVAIEQSIADEFDIPNAHRDVGEFSVHADGAYRVIEPLIHTHSAEIAALRQKAETDQIALQMYKQLSDEQLSVIAALREQVEGLRAHMRVLAHSANAVLSPNPHPENDVFKHMGAAQARERGLRTAIEIAHQLAFDAALAPPQPVAKETKP